MLCLFVCRCAVLARSRRSDQGGERPGVWWTVPRAGVRRAVLRAGARERVPRAGARLCERQVQSHPLMHILSQFYKHNLLACFTKLHILLLLKPG